LKDRGIVSIDPWSLTMPHRSTPLEQTWPSLASRKDAAAAKHEARAAQLRAEAATLRHAWRTYQAKQKASA
jgi:hypothetical protein